MSPDFAVGLTLLAPSVVFVAVAAVIANVRHPKTPTPTRPAAHSPRVGAGSKGQCSSTGCGYPASMWVVAADQFGGGVRWACKGCHDNGIGHGWWRLSLGANPTAFDFEIADDLDRLEHLANEDGVA